MLKVWSVQSYYQSKFLRKSLPLWQFHPNCGQWQSAWVRVPPGSNHSQILKAGNFAAFQSIDLKFSIIKDLNPFLILLKFQETSSI